MAVAIVAVAVVMVDGGSAAVVRAAAAAMAAAVVVVMVVVVVVVTVMAVVAGWQRPRGHGQAMAALSEEYRTLRHRGSRGTPAWSVASPWLANATTSRARRAAVATAGWPQSL